MQIYKTLNILYLVVGCNAFLEMKRYLIVVLVVTSSCTAIKIPSDDISKLAPFISNGREHDEFKIGENTRLIGYLFKFDQSFDSLRNGTIEVTQVSDKRLKLTLKNKGTTQEILFKGKINGPEFKAKNKTRAGGPLPPILWALSSNSNSFCFDPSDKLIIYHDHGGFMMVALIPTFGTSDGQNRYVFENVTD